MTTIRKKLFGTAFAALTIVSTAADATVYLGTDSIGTTSIALSVTTDGTLGTLSTANVTGWTVALTDPNPNNVFTFTPLNSSFRIIGDAVSATASSLTFDFASAGSDYFQFYEDPPSMDPSTLGFTRFYCLDTAFSCTGQSSNRLTESSSAVVFDQANRAGYKFAARSGIGVIGTAPVVSGAVPEPASWAMMVVGFGLLGAAMRRRAKVRVTYA